MHLMSSLFKAEEETVKIYTTETAIVAWSADIAVS
jgi:hypothetical protein